MREGKQIVSTIIGIVASAALIAGSACLAFAQDANSPALSWTHPNFTSDASNLPEPEVKTPLDVAGCWSGDFEDTKVGEGTGFLFFEQKGKKLIKGSEAVFTVSGLGTGGGLVTGSVTNKSFSVHFNKKSCKVNIRGRIVSGDLTGTYHISKTCLGKTSFKGTFDYTFDATGDSCD